ncbi:MAG: nitrite reductase/ring-hydroxylating ferredoxin subunit [Natronomonas sp.]|jgi:nitrite reductase/ring-hydroxylating ferredoxin subunit
MTRHEVCPAAELGPGERTVVEVDGLFVGVFNVDGEYHALNNVCPHQLAPLCEGKVTGTTCSKTAGEFESWDRDGEVLRCPWHGWEFDITNGESLFNPHVQTRTFETDVETTESGEGSSEEEEYGVALHGDEPPVDTYDIEIEQEMIVVYL